MYVADGGQFVNLHRKDPSVDIAIWMCLLILLSSGAIADRNRHCEYYRAAKFQSVNCG